MVLGTGFGLKEHIRILGRSTVEGRAGESRLAELRYRRRLSPGWSLCRRSFVDHFAVACVLFI